MTMHRGPPAKQTSLFVPPADLAAKDSFQRLGRFHCSGAAALAYAP